MSTIDSALLFMSLGITVLFFAYGFNIFYMIRLSRKYRAPPAVFSAKPTVAIHLPIFNERYVAERLLEACVKTAREYGKEKVRISVLDDSDDETTTVLQREAESYRSAGFNVDIRHRSVRTGFKAGALNEALKETAEDFIVVFDSDFLPRKDFLDRAVAYAASDDRIGVVQFRWSYTNRNYNWTTKAISIGMDAHFMIEQAARCAGGLFLNFNGSAGILRTRALRESGGWQADTLAEDLDASYRMQMLHYRIAYVYDDVPCEIPPTVASFKRQQARWARGSLQVAKKTLPKLLTDKTVTLRQKFEALVHLTYYAVHPLMYASFLLAATAAILNVDAIKVVLPTAQQIGSIGQGGLSSITWWGSLWTIFATSILLCTMAAWVYYIVAMRMQHISVLKNWRSLLALGFLGYGISVNNTVEAAKALLLRGSGVFKRTPKYAIVGGQGTWKDKKYQVPLDWSAALEAFSIALALVAIAKAIDFGNYGIVGILGVYASAYVFVSATTIRQRGEENARRPVAPLVAAPQP